MNNKEVNGVYKDKTFEEVMNGLQGGNYWRERSYSTDPDYSSVGSQVFEYLTEMLEEDYDTAEETVQLYLDHFTTSPGDLE